MDAGNDTTGNLRGRAFALSAADGSLGLVASLASFTLIEYRYGKAELGVYSFLFSAYLFGAYLADFGVSRFVERTLSLENLEEERTRILLQDGVRTILWTSALGSLILFGALFWIPGFSHLNVPLVSVIFLCASIPFHNHNRLRIAVLHASGRHETAANLRLAGRLLLLGTVAVLTGLNGSPAFLTLAFLLPEIALQFLSPRTVRLPSPLRSLKSLKGLFSTLREGQRTLFTDDALDVILYIDFMILGFFVSAYEEGVYAKASILARLFLVVPMSLEPLYRQRFCAMEAKGNVHAAAAGFWKATRWFFFWHAMFLLVFILYYPSLIAFAFPDEPNVRESLWIFETLSLGLLFYASVAAVEPVYEATDRIAALRRIVFRTFAVNLGLNLYLVPYAGSVGAAAATAVSMLTYFLSFGSGLDRRFRLGKKDFLAAGAAVYLCYMLFHRLDLGLWVALPGIPLVIFVLFSSMGFFREPSSRGERNMPDRTRTNRC